MWNDLLKIDQVKRLVQGPENKWTGKYPERQTRKAAAATKGSPTIARLFCGHNISQAIHRAARVTTAILAPMVLGFLTHQALAQSKADTSKPLVFEVASIKPTRNGTGPNTFDIPPGGQRFSATNIPLRLLIMIAYDVSAQRLSGGPGWVNADCYDIEAKAEHPASRQQIQLMLQSLLAERFNLAFHSETKEVPVYVLTAENYRGHLRENTSGGELRVSRGSSGQLVF